MAVGVGRPSPEDADALEEADGAAEERVSVASNWTLV